MVEQFKERFGNSGIKAQTMHVAFDGHIAQRNEMDLAILRDNSCARRSGDELSNQGGPLLRRNAFPAEQLGEYSLVLQSGREEWRENKINLVVLQLGQFGAEKRTEGIAVNAVRPK